MTLEQLRIFVAVAEKLHFTRAAHGLGLTQSAVSAAIAALEARHGVALFDRVGRHVELTAEGQEFLGHARDVLHAARHAAQALDELSGLVRGGLALMGSQTAGNYWLPPLVHRFRRRHPGVAVTLTIGNTAQTAAAVLAGDADVGLVEGAVAASALRVRSVAHDRLVLAVGIEHRWAAEKPVDAEALRRLPWVLREPGSGTRAATEALLASRGLSLADVAVAFEAPSNEAVRAAVEAGAGASVLSLLVAETGMKAGTLKAAACALPGRHFSLLAHRERRPSRATRAFIETLPNADLLAAEE